MRKSLPRQTESGEIFTSPDSNKQFQVRPFVENEKMNLERKTGFAMKISISSQGPGPDSMVDPRFGRAAQFVIYDTDTSSYTALSNSQSLNASHGAGIKAAETLSNQGVAILITGHCGPQAFQALKAAEIKIFTGAEGFTVSQALEKYQSGQLSAADASDVAGHWK
jgi:predicted Fe-Mo cluster-binding NifX family protein